ncbi:MAG: hypothetical protein ACYCQK_02105 [Acidiferrobacteraceae bacterium]
MAFLRRPRTDVGALRQQLYAATRQSRNLQPVPSSSFLQLVAAGKQFVESGSETLTWPGSSNGSDATAVTFAKPFTSTCEIALGAYGQSASLAFATYAQSLTSTGFDLYGWALSSTPAAGHQEVAWWIAIHD